MKLFDLQFIRIIVMICALLGALLLASATLIESLHLNDKSWKKPKYVVTLESASIWLWGTGLIILLGYVILYTVLNT